MGIEERAEQIPVQPANTEGNKPEPYDPEHLNDVVATFIETKGGKVFIREMVYALTLRQKVPKDLYKDVRRALRDTGIVQVKHGRYVLTEEVTPPSEEPAQDTPEDLEEKMRRAFSSS